MKGLDVLIITFIYELVEEVLENAIAYIISGTLFIFFAKVLSTILIITLTQATKVLLKKILYTIVRKITYKKGDDKMKKLKSFFTKIGTGFKAIFKYIFKSNPQTSIATLIVGCLATVFGIAVDVADVTAILNLPELSVFGVDIIPCIMAVSAYVLVDRLGLKYGRETNAEADARKQLAKEKKEAELKAEQEKKLQEEEQQKLVEFEETAQKKALEEIERLKKEAEEKDYNTKLDERVKEIIEQMNNKNIQEVVEKKDIPTEKSYKLIVKE